MPSYQCLLFTLPKSLYLQDKPSRDKAGFCIIDESRCKDGVFQLDAMSMTVGLGEGVFNRVGDIESFSTTVLRIIVPKPKCSGKKSA